MNHRTTIIVFTLFLLLTASFWGAAPVAAQQDALTMNPSELEAFMDGMMAAQMTTNHVPGAVVVVVQDGEVFFAKGYGYADLESLTPVDPQTTLFRPGSVSKLFVWTAVMQLVEQGKLSLDADVNEYLDFTIPASFAQPITLKNLMAHTPGFEDSGEGLFKTNPDEVATLEEMLKNHIPARVFPPGEVGAYSNYGTALAGYIVERVSGMPFYAYVEQNIFAPLGMTQATFRQPLPPELAGEMASGYNYVNGGYVQGGFEYVVAYPAGSLSATGLEMAKFMTAHLQNGRYANAQILNEDTAQLMHSQLYAPDPRMDGMAYGFFENTINGQRVISHNGDTLLFHTGLYLIPEQNLGLYISTNATGGASVPDAVAMAFADHYFPAAETAVPTPPSDFATRIPQYTGSYYYARSNFSGYEKFLSLLAPVAVSVDENNHVLVTLEGETRQYVEVEPGLLQGVDDPDREIVLKEDGDGRITLSPPIPFVFIKARWYENPNLHLLILLGGAAIFLFTMLSWFRAFVAGMVKKEKQPMLARLARFTASLFGLAYWLFLLIWLALLSDVNPAFGVPNLFLGTPDWLQSAAALPVLAGILGVAMVGWTAVAWRKRFWSVGTRLFYSFLTVWGLALLWSLHTWNFLL
ncbi:MAG: serine hydrolase [Ardenticatenaceae bacterium]|nr:serine hydrolase [Anaerolineales bacterium]MCB8922266.1 serine hydrolase [Ardenticatenaceae bacterium]MCB8990549.1 serine hydrolase [Ardenticatenaceae bacterium]